MTGSPLSRTIARWFLRRKRPTPPLPERMCVGMGSYAQMMVKAREVTRSPVLGCGIALTTAGDYPMEVERADADTWQLMVWIDRAADYSEHRRLKNLAGTGS